MNNDFRCINELDVVGVGFGPAGIALASAIADSMEHGAACPVGNVRFLEACSIPAWHPEFILPGTDINHNVFRDLVTPRNPRSRFSFAMYLHEKGRLYKFGILGRPASRHEWSDYVSWVGSQLSHLVSYKQRVIEILPNVRDGALVSLDVVTSSGVWRSKQLILSTGSYPNIPDTVSPHLGNRVFHTSQYLSSIEAFGSRLPKRWLVIGSGQSASEAIIDIFQRRHDCEVVSLHRSSGFKLAQFGHFPNLAFVPERVDYFHSLEPTARERLFREVKATNYAGIDPDESLALYSMIYEDAIVGRERLTVQPFSEAVSVNRDGDGYRVVIRDVFKDQRTELMVDAILLGTGYQQPKIPPLLSALQPWLDVTEEGALSIGRDYRILLKNRSDVAIFANGLSERSHGISDAQSFSLLALRAGRIFSSMEQQQPVSS
ncbi:L-lysine 6-monooxygenase [Paraburkholderia fungorum]|uniref:SidA/IucD/PvdA family monooxygenase n=1 Tax=Paraburkholderia fungorum TaxID=134537 RepID=UPI00048959B0|nr:SidA/IucD/PvdA family monooxygenase [Paraburkholderia fungorum]PNE59685.1 L-lysine 6-monooxygenase [Paraburkholderia fungorum]